MHANLHDRVDLCAQKDPACSPDSIDNLISLIRPNLAEIWACARKHLGCLHTSLHARCDLCAQRGPAYYPDSIDTFISLIRPNLAEIWACKRMHLGWMHASLSAGVIYLPDSIEISISLI